jgi:hypothetical protein
LTIKAYDRTSSEAKNFKLIEYALDFDQPEYVYINNCTLIGYKGGVYINGGKHGIFRNIYTLCADINEYKDSGGCKFKDSENMYLNNSYFTTGSHGLIVENSRVFLVGCNFESLDRGLKFGSDSKDTYSDVRMYHIHFEGVTRESVLQDSRIGGTTGSPKIDGTPDVLVMRDCGVQGAKTQYNGAGVDLHYIQAALISVRVKVKGGAGYTYWYSGPTKPYPNNVILVDPPYDFYDNPKRSPYTGCCFKEAVYKALPSKQQTTTEFHFPFTGTDPPFGPIPPSSFQFPSNIGTQENAGEKIPPPVGEFIGLPGKGRSI